MDIITLLGSTVVLCLSLVTLFGWSHKRLSDRINQQEKDIMERPKERSMKAIIMDKLAPHSVELRLLENRLDEIRNDQKEFDKKLDKLIEMFAATSRSH